MSMNAHPSADKTSVQWGYHGHTGPSEWGEIEDGFAICSLGNEQSPINIESRETQTADMPHITFHYTPSACQVVNNGHTIEIRLKEAGFIHIAADEYRLVQFHFHSPSEEQIDGKHFPMVAHFVHRNESGELAVIALLMDEGEENTELVPIFSSLPAKGERMNPDSLINPAALLPSNRDYFAYKGSLTTPPCSENVRWRVLKMPVTLSAGQIDAFRQHYPMNARPVQPVNDRIIRSNN